MGLVSILILSGEGCGYQFTVEGPGPVIGGGEVTEGPTIRLAVHTLKNNTFEPTLEFKYTQYIRQALQSSGSATIVEEDLSADFILDGAIVSVSIPSVAFSQRQTQEGRVTVRVAVKVRHRKSGEIRWTQANTNSAEFYVGASSSSSAESSGLQFNRALQDRALEQAGKGMAEDLADQFLSARDQDKFGGDSRKLSPAFGSSEDTPLSPIPKVNPFFSPTNSVE